MLKRCQLCILIKIFFSGGHTRDFHDLSHNLSIDCRLKLRILVDNDIFGVFWGQKTDHHMKGFSTIKLQKNTI